jgi:hypothetical protein
VLWTKRQEYLDMILHEQVLKFCTRHPDKKSILAIGPSAGEAAWLRPNPGEPAALPAEQVARLGQGLT